jgi:PncC family amidohydrolase
MDPAEQVLNDLAARHLTLAVAESDTGGLVLELLTAVPGSSAVVLGGVVAYADSLKRELLGIPAQLLEAHGSVSQEVAAAMARAVRERTAADIGLGLTGIAGPGGATPSKPVGLAFLAVATPPEQAVREYRWPSTDRTANRLASAHAALRLVLEMVEKMPIPKRA